MKGLQQQEWALFGAVFSRYPEIQRVCVFGSRALGTHRPNSDVDLVAFGTFDRVTAARIAQELDALPLPYLMCMMRLSLHPYGSILTRWHNRFTLL